MDEATARQHMERAIAEMWRSPNTARIGVVLARGDKVLASAHKGQDLNHHAEVIALKLAGAAGVDLRGSTAFVTLEPCANLENARIPCAQLLVDAGVTEVWIGRFDNNPRIYRRGWKLLRDHGVSLRDFPADLRAICEDGNSTFSGHFYKRIGERGTAKFDFQQNGGRYQLVLTDSPDSPAWETRWSTCGATSMYANGGRRGVVSHARYAEKFSEIDDPDALDWENHSPRIDIGEIAIFRNEYGYALCQLKSVDPPENHGGTGHTSMKFDYELRLR
ncbi:deaminase [Lentzea sp. CA-135723]|uniref:deaminase n=1 Tax=Lentzea sp. CA-135723 TaxID=3239950 RepID=UPI003D94CDFC